MGSYEKTLIGESIPLMEVDDEESSSLNEELITDAEIDADFVDLLDHFGKEDFREIFLNLYDEIIHLEIERQREICEKLSDKISDLYEYEFIPILTIDDENDVSDFLNFIEFIEFNYVDFLSRILDLNDTNIPELKKDVSEFLTKNWDKIYSLVEKYETNSELISKFLRTYNKESMFEFIRTRLEKDKMLVILKSMEGEFNDE